MSNLDIYKKSGDTVTFKFGDDYPVKEGTLYLSLTDELGEDPIISKKTDFNMMSDQKGIALISSDTTNLIGTYFYDVRFKDNEGNVQTPYSGQITFETPVAKVI